MSRPVENPDGLVKVQVYVPPELYQKISDAAGPKKISSFMREAAEKKLESVDVK